LHQERHAVRVAADRQNVVQQWGLRHRAVGDTHAPSHRVEAAEGRTKREKGVVADDVDAHAALVSTELAQALQLRNVGQRGITCHHDATVGAGRELLEAAERQQGVVG
jgi:hypothetical protein